ncbi:MAG: hypothetical protein IT210_17240 [Armatimonadetes bacterium]|nr:hypothetical protein [Armatimonadota bacterium]
MLPSIIRLYEAFDRAFSRPTSLHRSFHCCVSRQEERLLLSTPRGELTEAMLANPVDHLDVCFSTPDQGSYFVPRLVELLSEAEDGFQYEMLYITFYRLIRENERLYRDSGVWEALETALRDIFRERTSAFIFNVRGAGSVSCAFFIDDILNGFFFPILSKRQDRAEIGLTDWGDFFARWAEENDAA